MLRLSTVEKLFNDGQLLLPYNRTLVAAQLFAQYFRSDASQASFCN
jgi:hypothetical protein